MPNPISIVVHFVSGNVIEIVADKLTVGKSEDRGISEILFTDPKPSYLIQARNIEYIEVYDFEGEIMAPTEQLSYYDHYYTERVQDA